MLRQHLYCHSCIQIKFKENRGYKLDSAQSIKWHFNLFLHFLSIINLIVMVHQALNHYMVVNYLQIRMTISHWWVRSFRLHFYGSSSKYYLKIANYFIIIIIILNYFLLLLNNKCCWPGLIYYLTFFFILYFLLILVPESITRTTAHVMSKWQRPWGGDLLLLEFINLFIFRRLEWRLHLIWSN